MSEALSSGAFTRTRAEREVLAERAHIGAILDAATLPPQATASVCTLRHCAAIATHPDDFTALRVLAHHVECNEGHVRVPHFQRRLLRLYRELSPGVG